MPEASQQSRRCTIRQITKEVSLSRILCPDRSLSTLLSPAATYFKFRFTLNPASPIVITSFTSSLLRLPYYSFKQVHLKLKCFERILYRVAIKVYIPAIALAIIDEMAQVFRKFGLLKY